MVREESGPRHAEGPGPFEVRGGEESPRFLSDEPRGRHPPGGADQDREARRVEGPRAGDHEQEQEEPRGREQGIGGAHEERVERARGERRECADEGPDAQGDRDGEEGDPHRRARPEEEAAPDIP